MRAIWILTIFIFLMVGWVHMERVAYGKQNGRLFSIFKGGGKRLMFSDRYHQVIDHEWSCFYPNGPFELLSDSNRLKDDLIKITFLQNIFNDFTVLNNHSESSGASFVFKVTLLNNRPIVLTIRLVEERGNWVIDDIGNICELLEYIKTYKNIPKEKKVCIKDQP
jgi:hypothetical protein